MRYLIAISALMGVVACTAKAPAASAPVHWSVARVTGPTPRVAVTAQIDSGWHIYSMSQPPGGPRATRIAVAPGQPFDVGTVSVSPAPDTAYDSAFRMKVQLHRGRVTFIVPLVRSGTTRADSVRVTARYQVCNDSLCLPPQTATLTAAVARLS